MISFDIAQYRFDLRAVAVAVRGDYVLLHRVETDSFWSLPGGRVEPGEEAAHAVVREVQEELGVATTVDGLLFAVENFFEGEGKPHHEIGFYFAVSLPDDSPVVDVTREHIGVESTQRLIFRWFPRHDLPKLDLHPAFLRKALQENDAGIKHFVQHG
ncbi:NUDIX hydrolase [Cupriavidus necator]|uniref:NUDIX hydrolase n=1 Tax=Cupriavidus necator TaxID=106590 RepID=UPI0039C31F03